MKTIEERADAYTGHPEEIDEFTSETIKKCIYSWSKRAESH